MSVYCYAFFYSPISFLYFKDKSQTITFYTVTSDFQKKRKDSKEDLKATVYDWYCIMYYYLNMKDPIIIATIKQENTRPRIQTKY